MKKGTKSGDAKALKAGVSVKEVDLTERGFFPRRADPSLELDNHYARWNKSLDRIDSIHKKKSHDYATRQDRLANFRAAEKIGIPAAIMCFIRCMEKDVRKAEVLIKGSKSGDMCPNCGKVIKDESLMDTCYDDTVLNLLFIELWEEFRENPNFEAIMGHFKQIKKHLQDPSYAGEEGPNEEFPVHRCAHDIEDPEGCCKVGRNESCIVFERQKPYTGGGKMV